MPTSSRSLTEKTNRESPVYLTFDVDWACDEVLEYAISLVEDSDTKATFFITHDTPLLARLRENPNIELGVHPNFSPLLENGGGASAREILQDIHAVVPEAVAVRSHALMTGSLLSDLFYKDGLRIESNTYYHVGREKIIPSPAYDPCGMLRVFHFWEDDCHIAWADQRVERDWDAGGFLDYDGVRIFDFHPIHLFLNTEHGQRYESSRGVHRAPTELAHHRNTADAGAGAFFTDLIGAIKARNIPTGKIADILHAFDGGI
ncbi:MAG: hypothetical protein LBJ91_06270 [Clostridiales Family XIII bacterium]|jgi:hypothetical protein|nr:hypothetical protein [Clostridiales Family XIII bacterium]